MKRFGSELIFISRVKGDGSCHAPIHKSEIETLSGLIFELHRLSIDHDSYIAQENTTYVVKLKNPPK